MKFERTWQLPFSPATLYAAWVANDTVIPPATRMDIKPEVGGHYRLHAAGDGFTATNEGTFLVVELNQRLRYTWQWAGDEEVTEVDVTFRPNNGGTELELHHGTFISQESYTNHDNGWESYISGLTEFLQTRDTTGT